MFRDLVSYLRPEIAIDLGTANTVVVVGGEGIVLQEPSMVAMDTRTGTVRAVGDEAKAMAGRTPEHIVAQRPLRDGVIADFNVTEAMIRSFIAKVTPQRFLVHPKVLICVPTGASTVERQAVIDAARQVGARDTLLISESIAAGIGAGLPVEKPLGNMIVDIGGGTTEVAVISLGGIVTQETLRTGGYAMDEAVVRHVRDTYNVVIGLRSAEGAKIAIGSAGPQEKDAVAPVTGRDQVTGLPRRLELTDGELDAVLDGSVASIVDAMRRCLNATPAELAADILWDGIVLTGGGSLLRGLPERIADELGIATRRSDDPLTCVARGAAYVLADLKARRHLLDAPPEGRRRARRKNG